MAFIIHRDLHDIVKKSRKADGIPFFHGGNHIIDGCTKRKKPGYGQQ
jgi:hypothetical protein